MKRSQVNSIMRSADKFIRECGFFLPPFAYWTPEVWKQKGVEVSEIVTNHLGWDITDFGSGNFQECGLFLFTIRNGSSENWRTMQGKLFAEKLLVVDIDQITPLHFHWKKTEDIINRGGGNLNLQLYNSTPDEKIDFEKEINIMVDGVQRILPPGGLVTLSPGESITLSPYCYHKFWGAGGRVLVGEVSMVNDDSTDNRFADQSGRFPVIQEDEPPLYLLITDYKHYYRAFNGG
ncbi:MAG: D-lyxose/D-mannose family sugar isomerase [Anaerolineales bacterium]|nr:D-lyxose/D-mannose family sugar isomerase [Anaerolineales bacterium]